MQLCEISASGGDDVLEAAAASVPRRDQLCAGLGADPNQLLALGGGKRGQVRDDLVDTLFQKPIKHLAPGRPCWL